MIRRTLLFILSIALPLLIGFGSSQFSLESPTVYKEFVKPAFAPPSYLFGITWTILYIMMGIASYFVLIAEASKRQKFQAIKVYIFQLGINFFWTFFFFYLDWKLFSFFWIILLILALVRTMQLFFAVSKKAFLLLVPYLLWLLFAAYLNCGLYILN